VFLKIVVDKSNGDSHKYTCSFFFFLSLFVFYKHLCACAFISEYACSDKGYFVKDSIVLACDILECTPWLEFGDTDLTFSEPDVDAGPAAPQLPWPLEDEVTDAGNAAAGGAEAPAATGAPAASVVSKGGKETAISRLLNLAGLQLSTALQPEAVATAWGTAASAGATVHIQVVLQEKLAEDEELLQSFCNGMRAYLQVRHSCFSVRSSNMHACSCLCHSSPGFDRPRGNSPRN
jgi:hypothetical protein